MVPGGREGGRSLPPAARQSRAQHHHGPPSITTAPPLRGSAQMAAGSPWDYGAGWIRSHKSPSHQTRTLPFWRSYPQPPPPRPPPHPTSPTPPSAFQGSFGSRCPSCALAVPHRWVLWGPVPPIPALHPKHRQPRSASPPHLSAAPRPTRTVSCCVAARRSRIPLGAPSSPAQGGCGHGGRCVRGWAAPLPSRPAAALLGRVRIFGPGVGI